MVNATRFFLLFLITVKFSTNYEASATTEHAAGIETDYARVKRLGQMAINAYQNKEIELRRYLGSLVIINDLANLSSHPGDSLKDLLVTNIMARFFSNFQEILEPFISRENEVGSLSSNSVITACENDRINFPWKRVVLGSTPIKEDVNLALRNGHIRGKGYAGVNTLNEEGIFLCNQRVDSQEILVLGCGQSSQCRNNHSSHYTVDVNSDIAPDCISNFSDKRLWDMFNNQFEEIILEGAGNIKDVLLMTSIFKALKPGGIFKTFHFRSSLWEKDGAYTENAFLYDITIPLTEENPLQNLRLKEYFCPFKST